MELSAGNIGPQAERWERISGRRDREEGVLSVHGGRAAANFIASNTMGGGKLLAHAGSCRRKILASASGQNLVADSGAR
jgi:hypothetical protein